MIGKETCSQYIAKLSAQLIFICVIECVSSDQDYSELLFDLDFLIFLYKKKIVTNKLFHLIQNNDYIINDNIKGPPQKPNKRFLNINQFIIKPTFQHQTLLFYYYNKTTNSINIFNNLSLNYNIKSILW